MGRNELEPVSKKTTYEVEFTVDAIPLRYRKLKNYPNSSITGEDVTINSKWQVWDSSGPTPLALINIVWEYLIYVKNVPNHGEYPEFYFPDSRRKIFTVKKPLQ